jgi:peroxiredoxin
MAISIDAPEVAARTASKVGLHFPLLSDPDAHVIRQYRMFNPPMSMAHMGYVLIDAHGRVQARAVDGYFGAHSAAILQRLAHMGAAAVAP